MERMYERWDSPSACYRVENRCKAVVAPSQPIQGRSDGGAPNKWPPRARSGGGALDPWLEERGGSFLKSNINHSNFNSNLYTNFRNNLRSSGYNNNSLSNNNA